MTYRILGALLAVAVAAPSASGQPARDLYTRAMAQERLVRDDASKPTLVQMRRAVAMYETLVRKHPASGYCDNALWQAANLAALTFERFGQDADRTTAARLLTLLKSGY